MLRVNFSCLMIAEIRASLSVVPIKSAIQVLKMFWNIGASILCDVSMNYNLSVAVYLKSYESDFLDWEFSKSVLSLCGCSSLPVTLFQSDRTLLNPRNFEQDCNDYKNNCRIWDPAFRNQHFDRSLWFLGEYNNFILLTEGLNFLDGI